MTAPAEPERDAAIAGADEKPGDSACWLKRVCQQCGAIANADPPTTCPQCQAAITGD
jgi:rubrerythrin